MRVAVQFLFPFVVGSAGCIAAAVAGLYIGSTFDSIPAGVISWLILTVLVFVGGIRAQKWVNTLARINMDSWLSSMAECDQKYAFDGTGIAVDAKNRIVHLASHANGQLISKKYPFSDVREWEYEIPGKVMAFGNPRFATATGVAVKNAIEEEKVGFWVKVKDIDFPIWFIKFGANPAISGKQQKMELSRWMEILNQTVNG